jgi:hypothetical protein
MPGWYKHLICPFLMAEVPLPLIQAGEGHWPEDADVPQLKMVPVVLQPTIFSVTDIL